MAIERLTALLIRVSGILIAFDCSIIGLNMIAAHQSVKSLTHLGSFSDSYFLMASVLAVIVLIFLTFGALTMIIIPHIICKTLLPFKSLKSTVSQQQRFVVSVENIELLCVFLIGLIFISSALLYQGGMIGALIDIERLSTQQNFAVSNFLLLAITCILASVKLAIGLYLVFQTQNSVDLVQGLRNRGNRGGV